MKLSQPYSSARPCFLFSCVFLSSFERNTRSVLVFLSFSLLCCFSCACACLCVFYHLDRKIMNSFRESSRVMLLYGNFCCWPFFYSSSLFRGKKKEEEQSKVREFRNDLKAKYLCLIFVFVWFVFKLNSSSSQWTNDSLWNFPWISRCDCPTRLSTTRPSYNPDWMTV